MKKLLLLFFSVIILTSELLESQIINKWINLDSTAHNYTAQLRQNNLFCLNKDNIMIIDKNMPDNGYVLKISNDGGLTWNNAFESQNTEYEINSAAFPDINNYIWVGDSTEYQGKDSNYTDHYKRSGVIFTSTNSGHDWNKIKLDTNSIVDNIAMLDKNIGIANMRKISNRYNETLTYWDTLLYTTDFFKTYSKIPVPDSISLVYEIHIFDENRIILKTGNSLATVYKYMETTDRGKSWQLAVNSDEVKDIYFIDRQNAYQIQGRATSNPYLFTYSILKTIDGGKNWSVCLALSDTFGSEYYISSIVAADKDNVIIAGNLSVIFRTEDGGQTWVMEYAPNPTDKFQGFEQGSSSIGRIAYPDKNSAYGLIDGSYLLKMTNEKVLSKPILKRFTNKVKPNGINAEWTKINSAEKYQLQIASPVYQSYSYSNFKYPYIDTIIEGTSLILPEMDYNKCYHVRVRAISNNMDSEWFVRTKMFCTYADDFYTDPPEFINPKPNEIINTNKYEFIWSSIKEAKEYQFQYCDNSNFSGVNYTNVENLQDTFYLAENLIFNKTYYGRVKVTGGGILTEWKNITFKIVEPSKVVENMFDIGNNIEIFPNPADNYAQIKLADNYIEKFNIIDIYGNSFKTEMNNTYSNSESTLRINTSDLPVGLYYLLVTSGEYHYKTKFVVCR